MKRRVLSVLCACVLLSASVVANQGGPKPKPVKPPKPAHTSVSKSVKPPSAKVKPVKTTASKPAKPVKSTTKATKTAKPAKTTKSAKADVKGKKSTTASTTTSTTETTPTTTPAPGDTTVPLTKVQEKLKKNTNLASKLQGRLPAGTDLMTAADGFKNLGQFVAAVNVSYNHEGIAFVDLKKLMVDEGYSLGQAMQKLKVADATTQAGRAEYDANRLIQTTEKAPK